MTYPMMVVLVKAIGPAMTEESLRK